MKSIKTIALALITLLAGAGTSYAYDWKDLLKKGADAARSAGSTQTEVSVSQPSDDTGKSGDNSGAANNGDNSKGSDILSGLVSFLGDATGLNKLTEKDLVGTWHYVDPAISFQSENLLNKAGGVAAATVIVDKVRPYYQTVGLNNLTVTFNDDKTFGMGVGRMNLNGTYAMTADNTFTLDIKLMGRSVKQMTAYIVRQGKNISMTFDASGLITLTDTIATLTGNSTLKGLSSLLSSYDGMTVGFEMRKQ